MLSLWKDEWDLKRTIRNTDIFFFIKQNECFQNSNFPQVFPHKQIFSTLFYLDIQEATWIVGWTRSTNTKLKKKKLKAGKRRKRQRGSECRRGTSKQHEASVGIDLVATNVCWWVRAGLWCDRDTSDKEICSKHKNPTLFERSRASSHLLVFKCACSNWKKRRGRSDINVSSLRKFPFFYYLWHLCWLARTGRGKCFAFSFYEIYQNWKTKVQFRELLNHDSQCFNQRQQILQNSCDCHNLPSPPSSHHIYMEPKETPLI